LGMRGLALTYFSFFCCAGDDDLARPRAAGLRQAVPRAGEPDRRSLRPRPPLLKPRIQVQRERPFGTKRIGEWRRLLAPSAMQREISIYQPIHFALQSLDVFFFSIRMNCTSFTHYSILNVNNHNPQNYNHPCISAFAKQDNKGAK